jgi:hypothetical protein
MHLQGFDGYGCTACLHSASATGFSIDGVWGEQSDFAVLILWDADNQFEHPRCRYLPDWMFDGVVLSFRLAMVNCVQIDSAYYKWLDWGTLNVLYGDGTEQQVSLASCATPAGAAWDIAIDFSAQLGATPAQNVQRMWITFAPLIASGAAFVGGAWSATVTNWGATDANGRLPLKVAGPGSVRIEEDDVWVVRSGFWEAAPALGWWSEGRAIRAAASGASLTVQVYCGETADIYVGTRLDGNCGIISASLDGGTAVSLDCYSGAGANVRRKLFAGVAAGPHVVALTLTGTKNAASSGWYFYFDFLECAVPGDVPDAPEVRTDVAVACDFDTDNTYNLPPARLVWAIGKSGIVGEVDHYMGVFWWPARKCLTAASAWAQVTTITLSGTPAAGSTFTVNLGATALAHVCVSGDTLATVAAAFALLVNQGSTAFWAAAVGNVLTLTGLAGEAQYHMTVTAPAAAGMTAVVATVNGAAVEVDWGVDETAAAPVNGAVAAWHADYFATLDAAGIGVVVSFSQELVNPPDDPPGAVWVQRFADGTAVRTATGFGTLYSSQAAWGAAVQAYMSAAYAQMAAAMAAAGVAPRLQFGEVGWWFQAGGSPAGMAFYDADTASAAVAALGRALATFATPGDDPSINAYADADFLRARLGGYVAAVQAAVVAAVPSAVFEVLWPLDVNDPVTARLMRYVNLPAAWMARAGSGFDTFVAEGLSYCGASFDVDKGAACAKYAWTALGWDRAHCRYLMGWDVAVAPWQREYLAASRTGVPVVKMWAWDHLCLMGWALPMPRGARAGRVLEVTA